MIPVITPHDSLRSALDAALYAWAAVEILLRLANRNAEQGTDWTFLVVIASVGLGINLGFGAAHHGAHVIGDRALLGSVGLAIVIAGAGIALDSWLSVASLLLIPLAGVLVRISVEEARLRDGLGQSYRDYQARTWQLIPHVW